MTTIQNTLNSVEQHKKNLDNSRIERDGVEV